MKRIPYTLVDDELKPSLLTEMKNFTIDLLLALFGIAAIAGTVGYMWGVW